MPKAAVTKADIKRAVEAANDLGWKVQGFEVTKDGVIRILRDAEKQIQSDEPPRYAG